VRLALALPALFAATACGGDAPTGESAAARITAEVACTEPARPSPVVRGDTLPLPVATFSTENRIMDAVSRQVPGGFGGIWLEGDRVVISLKDPSQAEAAREALAALMPTDPHRVGPATPAQLRAARVEKARWSFSELFNWQAVTNPAVDIGPDVAGLTTTDLDEYANRISYGFLDEESMQRAAERLGALGLPCNLVTLHVTGPIRALGGR